MRAAICGSWSRFCRRLLGHDIDRILRSVGDARRAMHITLIGAVVNIALDPFFIFTLGLGINGAAIASGSREWRWSLMRFMRSSKCTTWRPGRRRRRCDRTAPFARCCGSGRFDECRDSVGNAYVTAAIAVHGDSAVAAWAIIGRIIPVAFGAIYALSGSIGPIIGQNYGAGDNDRMRRAFTLSLCVNAAFTLVAWIYSCRGPG